VAACNSYAATDYFVNSITSLRDSHKIFTMRSKWLIAQTPQPRIVVVATEKTLAVRLQSTHSLSWQTKMTVHFSFPALDLQSAPSDCLDVMTANSSRPVIGFLDIGKAKGFLCKLEANIACKLIHPSYTRLRRPSGDTEIVD
jgi:hypothetical protein